MRRGDEVYFIVKNVVRKGTVSDYLGNDVTVLYKKGSYIKSYKLKRSEIAVEIERGIDVGNRFGVRSNGKGDNGCNREGGNVRNVGPTNGTREKTSHNVLKGVWALSDMA